MRETSAVRADLLACGWTPHGYQALKRGAIVWAPSNDHGDSALSSYETRGGAGWTISFPGDVPSGVIVAAAEAAAKGARRA